mmetsp:Transcript_28273/g.90455  ORF Transcript_28273/g.90455 Transcript_28273/m.90455 type:complete len:242 (-) Transcript_28273:43-768(-)
MASYALLARLLAEGAEFKWKTSRGPKPPPPPPPPGVTFYVKLAAVGCAIGAGLGVYAYITYRRKLREHRLRRMSSAPHEPIIDTNRLAALEAGAGGKFRVLVSPDLGAAEGYAPHMSVLWVEVPRGSRTRTLVNEEQATVYYILRGYGIVARDDEPADIKAGDTVIVRPGSRHSLQPLSSDALVFLQIASPALDATEHEDRLVKALPRRDSMLASFARIAGTQVRCFSSSERLHPNPDPRP